MFGSAAKVNAGNALTLQVLAVIKLSLYLFEKRTSTDIKTTDND